MATLKAELQYRAHQQEGTTIRDRLFANADRVSAIGSALAPVSNWVQAVPGSDVLAEKLLGIARERDLPSFRRESFVEWANARETGVDPATAERKVLLFPDTDTNYSRPEVGKAAVQVLEAAGVVVHVPDWLSASGRAAYSKGFLDLARERARENVQGLAPDVGDGWDVVVIEPSDAVMFQSDYPELLSGEAVQQVAANTYGFCEYVDRYRLDEDLPFESRDESLVYHGHCHQKATGRDHHAVAVLRRAGYAVDPLDSGCCGMAGSFGYEAEHYSMSQAIASILDDQVAASAGDVVVAPGASCRTQLGDRLDTSHSSKASSQPRTSEKPPHSVELLAAALES